MNNEFIEKYELLNDLEYLKENMDIKKRKEFIKRLEELKNKFILIKNKLEYRNRNLKKELNKTTIKDVYRID